MLKQILNLKGVQTLLKEDQKLIQGGNRPHRKCIIAPNGSTCTVGGQFGCCNDGQCDTSGSTVCK